MMNSCEKNGRDNFFAYLNECINANLVQSVLEHWRYYRNVKRPGLKILETFDEMPNVKKLQSSAAPYKE